MSFLTKNLRVSHFRKQFWGSYYFFNELRLSCSRVHILNNSLHFKARVLNSISSKDPSIPFVPERKLMLDLSHLGFTVKKKIEDTYDSVRHLGRKEERMLGFKWFETLDDINYKEYFTLLELPDTFYSWFKVMELHTWMLLLNLPQKTRSQKTTRIGLINAMWIDTERRSKILAPSNKHFKKNMKSLCERFRVTLYLYDDGYFNTDRELSSAIWFNFFEKENVDPRFIEVLVSYIRCQVQYLNSLGIVPEKVKEENLKLWTPLTPHFESIFQGP